MIKQYLLYQFFFNPATQPSIHPTIILPLSIELLFARLKVMQERNYFELERKQNKWFHAYLLVGKNKDSKQELINYIIEGKNCLPADISTVTPEESSGKRGEIKIEQIKELLHQISLSPLGKCRIAVIYNAERLNQSSGNILLKTLEEPAGDVLFILSAENNSVLPTIKSRCRTIFVHDNTEEDGDQEYAKIVEKNFVKASFDLENIVKNNQINEFLDDILDYCRKKMLSGKKSNYGKVIYRIEEVRKEIAGNANPRLALENLYLMLKSINQ